MLTFVLGLAVGAIVVAAWALLHRRSGGPPARHDAAPPPTEHGELAAAREAITRLQTALDALPVGVVLADATGEVVVRNASVSSVGGSVHADVLVAEAIDVHIAAARSGQARRQTIDLFGPPRKVIVVRAEPIDGGGALVTIEDVSERSRVDAVRTDFVANISHELKTPVAALSVLAEALSDEDDVATMRRLAGKMVAEAGRVARTIDDLLELSRIEMGGEAVRDAVGVAAVLHEAVERARPVAEARAIRVQLHEPPDGLTVLGDRRQLVSAVGNLVENAAKYSDEGGVVTVSAAASGDHVELVVADTGIGIPARDLDRVFERFYRVDRARSRATGGTGLGLAIVRHVATNHGGEVTVQSVEGEGSTFTLRVPTGAGWPLEGEP